MSQRPVGARRNIFDVNEAVSSTRLRLSRLDATQIEPMTWLEAALSPDWSLDDLRRAVEAGDGVLIADVVTGESIGVAVALLDVPATGAASVPFIAIAPARRFRGLGGEAGLALERHLRSEHGVTSVYAPAPDGRGLAVYFWLRLGYRPLSAAEGPGPLAGLGAEPRPGIWMVRDEA
jgi:GNAT superfamily N-acetyltransferase